MPRQELNEEGICTAHHSEEAESFQLLCSCKCEAGGAAACVEGRAAAPAVASKAHATAASANAAFSHSVEAVVGIGLYKPLGLRPSQII